MNSILIFVFNLFVFNSILAQDIDFKKDKVLLDDKPILSYDKRQLGWEISIFKLDTKNEIIFGRRNDGGTREYKDDDFVVVKFINEKVTVENASFARMTWPKILELMVISKVFDENNKINPEGVANFVLKYHEKITDNTTTIIHKFE